MSLLEAVLMGILQGITEFLPVSSSGHLAIFKNVFEVNTNTGLLFDILLHVGTLVAVCIVYFKDIIRMVIEGAGLFLDIFRNIGVFVHNLSTNRRRKYYPLLKSPYRKLTLLILISTIPTGIFGLLLKGVIEVAEGGLLIPGVCLIATGVLLLISDHIPRGDIKTKEAGYKSAAWIGICQGVATLPGLSRSGTTITACMVQGFDRKFAVKYSFLMSIPVILGAAFMELKDIGKEAVIPKGEMFYYIAGMSVAGIVGYVCIKTMLVAVKKKKFKVFSFYCLMVGILSIVGYVVM